MAKKAVIHTAFLNAKGILRRTAEHNSSKPSALACEGDSNGNRQQISPRRHNNRSNGVLLGNNAGALEAIGQSFVLGANFVRQAVAKFLKELSGSSYFFGPIAGIHAKQFIKGLARDCKAVEIERTRSRNIADRCFGGIRALFNAVEHPFQDAYIFAVSGPEQFPALIPAEPIHMENFGSVFESGTHLQPMPEIIAHVVTAERKHGHGITPRHTHK